MKSSSCSAETLGRYALIEGAAGTGAGAGFDFDFDLAALELAPFLAIEPSVRGTKTS
jgi:hypothetical protein